MGLAAPKNKIKLSHDPNNTRWQSDKSSFGHKIMTNQGWQPGEYLGVKDAAHAEFHTAANASHIRVSIKDDKLGLGQKVGSGVGHGECTGLDAFKNLLGRLNGKEEDEIEKEQRQRDDIRRAIFTEKRWGSVRFVSGGFLIGDKIQVLIDAEAARIRKMTRLEIPTPQDSESDSNSSTSSEEEVEIPKKSKKRKAAAIEEPEVVAIKVKKSKKERKLEAAAEKGVREAMEHVEITKKKSKKERKSKAEPEQSEDDTEIKKRKKEKKDKKELKKREKEAAALTASEASDIEKRLKKKSKKDKHKAESFDSSDTTAKESTPAAPTPAESSGRSTPMMQGRHAVRSRNIAQKRLASMDIASLNQIFMIKSQS